MVNKNIMKISLGLFITLAMSLFFQPFVNAQTNIAEENVEESASKQTVDSYLRYLPSRFLALFISPMIN